LKTSVLIFFQEYNFFFISKT